MKITLPDMPDGFTTTIESNFGEKFLILDHEAGQDLWDMTGQHRDGDTAKLPGNVLSIVSKYIEVSPRYEWAANAHCPEVDGQTYPMCGSASASANPLDSNPVVATIRDFTSLPDEDTCWECRSIIA